MKSSIGLSLFLLCACDSLRVNPGGDFRIEWKAKELPLFQRVSPIEIEYTVTGCDDYEVFVDTGNARERRLHRVTPGSPVPVEVFHDTQSTCANDEKQPAMGTARLVARCAQDGRETESKAISYRYATAYRAHLSSRGGSDAIIPLRDGTFFTLGGGFLSHHDWDKVLKETPLSWESLVTPAGTTNGQQAFVAQGCPGHNCGSGWVIDTPTYKRGGGNTQIAVFDFGQALEFRRALSVVGNVAAMVDYQGEAWALTSTTGFSAIWRLSPDEAHLVSVVEEPLARSSFTVIDGELTFITRSSLGDLNLYNTSGNLIATAGLPERNANIEFLTSSTDGLAWALGQKGQAWAFDLKGMPGARAFGLLVSRGLPSPSAFPTHGALLADGSLAVHSGSELRVFAPQGTSAVTWTVRSESEAVLIRDIQPAGTGLAVLTPLGVQFFDSLGTLRGGADPLPRGCGKFNPHWAVLADGRVVLGGSVNDYVFRTDASDGTNGQ